jgi:hypothetical protein
MMRIAYWIKGFFVAYMTFFSISSTALPFSKTYIFEPKIPTIVVNPLLWHLDTRCTIKSTEAKNTLVGRMERKTGALNDKALKEGEAGSVVVKNQDVLHVTADYGAQIEIINQGKKTVIARCKI